MQNTLNLSEFIKDAIVKAVKLSPTYPKKISFNLATKWVDEAGTIEVVAAHISCNGKTVPEYSDKIEDCTSVRFELPVFEAPAPQG